MSHIDFQSFDRHPKPASLREPEEGSEPFLVMRPESFFSHRFHMHLDAQEGQQRPGLSSQRSATARAQRADFSALRMTLLIAIPFLLYWVVSVH